MRFKLSFFLTIFIFLLSPTAYAKKKPSPKPSLSTVPPLLVEIETKYAEAKTLVAAFTQLDDLASLKRTKSSSGRISIRRPDHVRWETVKPNPGVFVSDGKRVWMYTPPFDAGESGELRMGKASQIHSKLAQALLSGAFSMATDMYIERTGGADFTLTPKPGAAGSILKASIHINLIKKYIDKVSLDHKGGNKTEITLSDIELGRDLPKDVFVFVAPPGTVTVKD